MAKRAGAHSSPPLIMADALFCLNPNRRWCYIPCLMKEEVGELLWKGMVLGGNSTLGIFSFIPPGGSEQW